MIAVSSPGRICLFGEHQDYLGLPVIAAAVNIRAKFTATANDTGIFRIVKPDVDEQEEIDPGIEQEYRSKRDYLRSAVNVLRRDGFRFGRGYDITLRSAIPIGKGCSSSSAILVAWIGLLGRIATDGRALTPGEAAQFGYFAEVKEFKEPGGMMDHYTSALGGMVYIETKGEIILNPLPAALPGVFTQNQSGSGPGSILGQKPVAGSIPALNTAANPASVGDYLLIYCTGLGTVTPSIAAGAAASYPPLYYTDNTVTKGTMKFPLSKACLTVSSVLTECSKMATLFPVQGWAKTTTCSSDGGQCNCTAQADQTGSLGVVFQNASTTGSYTSSSGGLNADGEVDYSYCVSGDTLTLTPKPTILPLIGTVVLQKASSPGSGGAPGSGGKTGAGGNTVGSGGAAGAGGATLGSGGKTGAGGNTVGSGGAPGSGGITSGSGGMAGAGGSTVGSGGVPGSGGKTGAGGSSATGGTTGAGGGTGTGPCDIYAAASTKCVAAHSTVRALYGSYSGPLYQVKRADGTTKDISVLSPGGFADSAAQDAFCTSACTITRVYDQSGNGNLVAAQTPDTTDMTPAGHSGMTAASATKDPTNVGGHKVYSLYTNTSQAYWHDGSKSGMPTGSNPQGVYMVTNSTHVNSGCCYDYGNGETSRTYVAGPSMDSIYFGSCTQWAHGTGSGPWIMADMEDGMQIGNSNQASITYKYVTAIEKNNGTSEFALRGADATSGSLSTFYMGALPSGYGPNSKQGAIVLGSGGDCCYCNNNGSALDNRYSMQLLANGTFDVDVTGYTPVDATIASTSGGEDGSCLKLTATANAFPRRSWPGGCTATPTAWTSR